jgi:asparagine synthase (glutamine-hydrolysing)
VSGFAGWTGDAAIAGGDLPILRTMGRYLAPRGEREEIVQRAHCRAVLRGQSRPDGEGARQRFVTAGGRLIALIDGEIFNRRELTRQHLGSVSSHDGSDAGLVAHLYRSMGADFLTRLNGTYAIVLWDDAERMLLLARDRLGVKPLYYTCAGDSLVFASELKALLVHPGVSRTLDWAALEQVPDSTFPFGRPAGRPVATGIERVGFVEPGTSIEWREGRLGAPARYWRPPAPLQVHDTLASPAQCVDRYAELLAESVRLQVASDTPLGLSLSGGLDSSLLASLASRCTAGLTAFTLVEPAIVSTGDTAAAARLARHLGIPLHLVRVDDEALSGTFGLTLAALEYFVWTMDFPVVDMELLFKHELYRHARAVRPDITIMLNGQGADEFAGGYSALGSTSWDGYAEREARVLHASLLAAAGMPSPYQRFMNPRLAAPLVDEKVGDRDAWQYLRFSDLPAYNLWHEDRMAAAHGMEARMPFLDHRLVELLCSIPRPWREELYFDKKIARCAAGRVLPPEFVRRPTVSLVPWRAGADDAVSSLRRFVCGVFDDYRQKYLEAPDALFAIAAMESLRDLAAVPVGGDAAARLLGRCMTISIFARLCRELPAPEFDPPRLGAAAAPSAAEPVSDAPGVMLSATSRITLADSVRLAISCERPPALLVIQDGRVVARIPSPAGWDWTLAPRSAFAAGSLAMAPLAAAVGVELDAMSALAAAFVARGWGVIES